MSLNIYLNLNIRDFGGENGSWNWNLFQALLPSSVCMCIAGILPPSDILGNDEVIWGVSNSANFITASVYELIEDHSQAMRSGLWNFVWHCYTLFPMDACSWKSIN